MNKFFEFNQHIVLAEIFNECTAYQISIEYLNKALDISRYLPINNYRLIKVYELRGKSKIFLNNYQEAIVDFSKALEIDPKNSFLYFWRGFAFESLRQYPNAIKDLKKSNKLDPEFQLTKIILDHIERNEF